LNWWGTFNEDPYLLDFTADVDIYDRGPGWLGSGIDWMLYGNLNDVEIRIDPVPEPATMLLLGSGLIGLAGYRRKKGK
jgi:hypothetical protein